MTTIAWKDGVLAVDRLWSCNNATYSHKGSKIYDLSSDIPGYDKFVLAGCGDQAGIAALVRSLKDGCEPFHCSMAKLNDSNELITNFGSFSALAIVIDSNRKIPRLFLFDCCLIPLELNIEEATALGSGSEYALGAMMAGATAKQAVEIAAYYDHFTKGPFDCFSLHSYLE